MPPRAALRRSRCSSVRRLSEPTSTDPSRSPPESLCHFATSLSHSMPRWLDASMPSSPRYVGSPSRHLLTLLILPPPLHPFTPSFAALLLCCFADLLLCPLPRAHPRPTNPPPTQKTPKHTTRALAATSINPPNPNLRPPRAQGIAHSPSREHVTRTAKTSPARTPERSLSPRSHA
jgi:hypothetical protein